MTVTHRQVKSIAIIGGGASGSVILDALKQEGQFDTIKLFERRDKAGGVWVLDTNPSKLSIPPGVTEVELDPPLPSPFKAINSDLNTTTTKPTPDTPIVLARSTQERYIHTATYEELKTNIPEQLMTFSDLKTWGIPQNDEQRVDEKYVHGTVIQKYIEAYLNRNISHVEFNTTVEDVSKDYSDPNSQFELTLRKELPVPSEGETGELKDHWYKEKFDAVVIATGHYHVPYIPDVPGLSEVYKVHPDKIRHSKTFRTTDDFQNRTVIVIGTRASGSDIAQIALSKGVKKVYQSKRTKNTAMRDQNDERHVVLPKIERFELNQDGFIVHFKDGTKVVNPDEVIYATGFRYSYPFLRNQYPGFTNGEIIPELYQHTFYIKDPSLSIIGVPTDAISFRAFEYQAVLVSRFLAGKVELPDEEKQFEWALQRYKEKGDSRAYHTIDFDGKFEYLELLTELGGGAEPIGGSGRPFPVFTNEDIELHNSILETFRKFFSVEEDDTTTITTGLNGVTIP